MRWKEYFWAGWVAVIAVSTVIYAMFPHQRFLILFVVVSYALPVVVVCNERPRLCVRQGVQRGDEAPEQADADTPSVLSVTYPPSALSDKDVAFAGAVKLPYSQVCDGWHPGEDTASMPFDHNASSTASLSSAGPQPGDVKRAEAQSCEEMCSIDLRTVVRQDDACQPFPCGHRFHRSCMEKWRSTVHRSADGLACPNCRAMW
mmetsp:Transcript_7157/g.21833  ORF Transcript_7157/g.21833 Transcript_7157/m.21833 type:complete len:203 (-) Transcript_7157:161-769(-)